MIKSNPATVSPTAKAIHFGVPLGVEDTAINWGAYFYESCWNPPIITHGDDWEDWNNTNITSGAVHMVLGVEPINLSRGLHFITGVCVQWLVPMKEQYELGILIVVTNARDWSKL